MYVTSRPNSTHRDYRLREVVDWEAAACQLECQWVDSENSQDGEFIANCFINEAETLNAATDRAPASNATSSPVSDASSRVEADSPASNHDSQDHSAHSGRHFNGQANEAVASDGPREALADGAGYSTQPFSTTAPCALPYWKLLLYSEYTSCFVHSTIVSMSFTDETKDTKYKVMIHYMVEIGMHVDTLAPTALINDYQLAINGITPELFKMYDSFFLHNVLCIFFISILWLPLYIGSSPIALSF